MRGIRRLCCWCLLLCIGNQPLLSLIKENHNWTSRAALDYMNSENATLSQKWVLHFLSTQVNGRTATERLERLKTLLGFGSQQVDEFEDTEALMTLAVGGDYRRSWDFNAIPLVGDLLGYVNYTSSFHFLNLNQPGIYNTHDGYAFIFSVQDFTGLDYQINHGPANFAWYTNHPLRSVRAYHYRIGSSSTPVDQPSGGCTKSQDNIKSDFELHDLTGQPDQIRSAHRYNYCDYSQIIWEPVTNLALYWIFRTLEPPLRGESLDDEHLVFLGNASHAAQDVAVPHHVHNTMGLGHQNFEVTLVYHFERDENSDGIAESAYFRLPQKFSSPPYVIQYSKVLQYLSEQNRLNDPLSDADPAASSFEFSESYSTDKFLSDLAFRAHAHPEVLGNSQYWATDSAFAIVRNDSGLRFVANQAIANTVLLWEKTVIDGLLGRNGLGGGRFPLQPPGELDHLQTDGRTPLP